MFEDDDNLPQSGMKKQKDLTSLSVSELKDYIDELKEEQKRAEQELNKKENYSSELDNFFKT